MHFRVLYVVLWVQINHSPNYKQWKIASYPVPWRSLKLGATKKIFTSMKAHTFTDTRILNVHGTKSHCGCICVCGLWCGFKIFPVSVSVQCSFPNNASQQCFPEVTNFGMAQRCYSKDQLWQPVRWGNVQHSLNMSSVCSRIFRHVSMCITGLLQMISITVMASRIDSGELVFISSLA
jgi:hypothetical protein